MYATRWVKEQPVGPRSLTILHDHLRAATTYSEADPASWQEQATAGGNGGVAVGAGSVDTSSSPDTGSSAPDTGAEPAPVDARRTPSDATAVEPPAAADEDAGKVAAPAVRADRGGCALAPTASPTFSSLLLVVAAAVGRALRRRRR